MYAATPGGGGDARPCMEGYLNMAVVCVGGEKVFFDVLAALLLLLLLAGVDCEW